MTAVKLEQESREGTCNTSTGSPLGNRILDWLSPGSTTRGSVGDLIRLGAAAACCYFSNPLAGCVLKAGCVSGIGDSTCLILDSGSHMLLTTLAGGTHRAHDDHQPVQGGGLV